MDKVKQNLIYLILIFSVTFIYSIFIYLFYFIHQVLSANNFGPLYHLLIWFFIFCLIVSLFVNYLGINIKNFFGYSVIVGMFGSIFFVIVFMVSSAFLPSSIFHFLPENYSGMIGYTLEEDGSEDMGNRTFVFSINDARIAYEYDRLKTIYESDEHISSKEFIFWQTAYVSGYDTKYIEHFNNISSAELYISVGLFSLIEVALNSLYVAFTLMLIPIIGLFFGERLFFSDLGEMRKFFKQLDIQSKK